MSSARKVFAVAVLAALAWGALASAEAQPSLRIGASFSNTGSYAQLGQTVHRGQQLCVNKMVMFQWQDGKKVIVWPEELASGKARFPTPPWSQR